MKEVSEKAIHEGNHSVTPIEPDSLWKPYVGPVPFQKEDQDRFFGREMEADDLACLIEANSVVLLYAQSGAGKSSLVNAKLIPMLEKDRKCEVLVARPGRLIPHEISPAASDGSVFIFNSLADWTGRQYKETGSLSLTDFLGARPHQKLEHDIESIRVLVFDQFEEIFTAPYPHRSRDRQEFFMQLRESLKADHLLRVLFSIREEYIASLEPYARLLPEGFRTRRRLERLRADQAQLALCEPLRGTEYSFDSDVVETLLQDLMTSEVKDQDNVLQMVLEDFVEPVQLGVVCEFVWRRLLESGGKVITKDLLVKSGDVNGALIQFYEDCISKTVRETNADERKLRRFFHFRLITEYGTRGSCLKGEKETGDVPNEAFESLDRLHLIRSEYRASAIWYELTHDRFISPIVKANQKWLREALKPSELESGEKIHEMALHWSEGRRSEDLLRDVDLERAEALLLSPYAPDMGLNTELIRSYIEKSRDLVHQRKVQVLSKQRRWLAIAAAVAAISFFVAAVGWLYAYQNIKKSQVAEHEAKNSMEKLYASKQNLQASEAEQMYQAARMEVKRQEEEINSVTEKNGKQAAKNLQANLDKAREVLKTASVKLRDVISRVGTDRTQHASAYNTMWLGQLAARGPNDLKRSAEFATAASRVLPSNPIHAILLAKYGVALARTLGSVEVLYDALAAIPMTLESHTRQVYPVAFIGSDQLVSAGADGTARIWNMASGQPVMILVGHLDTIWDIAISPENRYIATASQDKTARIWDAKDGSEIHVLKGHTSRLWSIAFSPDGLRVATSGEDKTVRIWDVKTGHQVKELALGEVIYGVAFSPDGKFLAAIGTSGTVILFDAKTLSKRSEIKAHKNWGYRVAFSPDSSAIVTTSLDGTAAIHKLVSNAPPMILQHGDMVGVAAFSHDGRRIATGDHAGKVRVWDALSGARLLELDGKCGAVFGVAFGQDDSELAAGCEDFSAKVWSLWGRVFGDGREPVSGLALSRDGSLIAAGTNTPHLWDRSSGRPFPSLESGLNQGTVTAVSISMDATRMASGGSDGTVTVFSLDKSRPTFPLVVGGGSIRALALSPDGRRVAAAAGGTLRVWDLESTKPRVDLPSHASPIDAVAFEPDASALVIGDERSVTLWNFAEQRVRWSVSYGSRVTRVDISPDGQWVAVGGGKNAIKLWKVISPAETLTFPGMGDDVIALRFSTEGSRISAGAKDGAVKSWDLKSQKLLDEIQPGGRIVALDFSADHNVLSFARADGTIRAVPFRVDLPDLMLRASTMTGSDTLDAQECNKYLGTPCPIP